MRTVLMLGTGFVAGVGTMAAVVVRSNPEGVGRFLGQTITKKVINVFEEKIFAK